MTFHSIVACTGDVPNMYASVTESMVMELLSAQHSWFMARCDARVRCMIIVLFIVGGDIVGG